ncbi:MAG: DUF3343 domain-containing protein [Eubacteriales bacterium]|nr:DUF3343 domain-containing protein [Eubacteriales bacterium]
MIYIATFYSHFGSVRFKKRCDAEGIPARQMPVPRTLSSSCGTCVRYEADSPKTEFITPGETEQIVEVLPGDGAYNVKFKAENS